MPSGKRSKQLRRTHVAAPPVRSKGMPVRRQASPRVLAAGGAVVAVVAIAIVLAAVLSGGKGSSVGPLPTNGSLATGMVGAADVHAMLKRIPQRGLTLGSATAPVTLLEYVDLQCPLCREFETQVLPDIIHRYVRTGKIKIEARVLAFIGPDSSRGRAAMIAAGLQGKAFDFAQLLYDNQQAENGGWLSDAMVARAAKSIPGLNPRQLFSVRNSGAVRTEATTFDRQAAVDGVKGTPTLFVGRSGHKGTRVALAGPTDEQSLVDAIQTALGS